MSRVKRIVALVESEVLRAQRLHGPMSNGHEALAVIEEEIHEFKEEVYKKQRYRSNNAMRDELVQVAAMAVRALHDLKLDS